MKKSQSTATTDREGGEGEQRGTALEEEEDKKEEILELPTSGPVRITVTSASTETGGVQEEVEKKEEDHRGVREEQLESSEKEEECAVKEEDKEYLELTTSGISLTTVTSETGGVQGNTRTEELRGGDRRSSEVEERGGEEYIEKEESVELTTSSLRLTTVTEETGGVHGAGRLEEELPGRRRRKSVKERVEEIERGAAVVESSRERLMSDRKKKF